jgi:hypothetical protein
VDGVTGILTQPGDEMAITQAMIRLAEEPGLAARMGQAGRARAEEIFSSDATLPELESRLTAATGESVAPARQPLRLAAFYDLAQPMAVEMLSLEREVLETMGCQIWLAGGEVPYQDAKQLGIPVGKAFWMPDGMALEMEWQSRGPLRSRLELLRTELSTSIDGEFFLQAARRALWLALQAPKLAEVQGLYACGRKASLSAWLVHRLTGLPIALKLEREDAFEQKVRNLIRAEARAVLIQPEEHGEVGTGLLASLTKRWARRRRAGQQEQRRHEHERTFRAWLQQSLPSGGAGTATVPRPA